MFPRFLNNDYPLEKHLFFGTRYAYSLLGLHFEKPQTVRSLLWLTFNFFNLVLCCQSQFNYGWYYRHISIRGSMDALSPFTCASTTLFKMAYTWLRRKEVAELMRRMRFLTEQQNNEEHRNLKRGYYNIATRSAMIILAMGSMTTVAFVLGSLWEMSVNLRHGLPIKYDTPFRMLLPERMHRMPLYPITYAYSSWCGQLVTYAFVGTDAFFFGFTLYITFLLKALQMDVKLTLKEVHNATPYDNDLCHRRLVNIIDRHNEILDVVHKFSRLMAAPTFVHFLSASFVIAMSVIAILMFSGYDIVRYLVYSATVSSAIFLYCYGGTEMATASLELSESVYNSHWYCWNREIRKKALLLMLRAQTPIIVEVPFIIPSFALFASVIKFTGSIVALAKTIL